MVCSSVHPLRITSVLKSLILKCFLPRIKFCFSLQKERWWLISESKFTCFYWSKWIVLKLCLKNSCLVKSTFNRYALVYAIHAALFSVNNVQLPNAVFRLRFNDLASWASAAETVDSGLVAGLVKSNTIKIGIIHCFLSCLSAIKRDSLKPPPCVAGQVGWW